MIFAKFGRQIVHENENRFTKMNPFQSLDQESLLDALTEYYYRYRLILEKSWNEKEFTETRDTLLCILDELNRRNVNRFRLEEFAEELSVDVKST